jgi:Sporulation and spore germination
MQDLELRPPGDAPPPPQAPPPKRASRRVLWLALAACVVVLGLGAWIVAVKLPDWLLSAPPATVESTAAGTAAADARHIQATLFYVSGDGTALVAASREVPYGATPAEQVRLVVESQVAAPPNERLSAIPKGTTVRSVFLTDAHEAYVDLGGTIASGQTGGSLDEALTVYAIVNAVTANAPDITGVQILIEGKEVDSLAGHLDLRAPLGKAADWIQKGP